MSEPKGMISGDRSFAIVFAGLFLAFLWPLLVLKESFIAGDFLDQHLPWAWTLYEQIQAGQLPYWVRGMACGFPLVAEGQIGAFYFLHQILYRTLPFIAAYTWSIPLHLLLGAGGVYVYSRSLGLGRQASWLAVVLFAFGGGYGGCFSNTASLRALTWLPWCLWFCEKSRADTKPTRWLWLTFCAILLGQQWLAGSSQVALYSFLYVLLHEFLAGGVRSALRFLAALTAGMAMAAPQFFLTAELVGQSVRAQSDLAFALWGSVPPVFPVALVFPEWGNLLGFSFYLGILPLFFILTLFFVEKKSGVWRHGFLAIFFALLALGKLNPFYIFAVKLLHLEALRNPAKFLFFALTSMCFLAGFGLDALTTPGAMIREKSRQFLSWARRLLALLWILPALGFLSFLSLKPFWPQVSNWYVQGVLAAKGARAASAEHYLNQMNSFFSTLETLFSYANLLNGLALLLATACFWLIYLFLEKKISIKIFLPLVANILFLDLLVFGFFLGTGFIGNAASLDRLKVEPLLEKQLALAKSKEGLWVEFRSQHRPNRLPPNAWMYYGARGAGGYSPLLLKSYEELTRDLGISDSSLGRPISSLDVWARQKGILDVLGARWIRSYLPLSLPGLKKESYDQGTYFYENTHALPEIAVFYQWRLIPESQERLAWMKSKAFNSRHEIIVTDSKGLPENYPSFQPATDGTILNDQGSRLEYQINALHDGVVFVRNAAYPGWRVFVDGKESSWQKVNHAFIGFPISRGLHHIKLLYKPSHWLELFKFWK